LRHAFYASLTKWSLRKQRKNYPKIHCQTRGAVASSPPPWIYQCHNFTVSHYYITVCYTTFRSALFCGTLRSNALDDQEISMTVNCGIFFIHRVVSYSYHQTQSWIRGTNIEQWTTRKVLTTKIHLIIILQRKLKLLNNNLQWSTQQLTKLLNAACRNIMPRDPLFPARHWNSPGKSRDQVRGCMARCASRRSERGRHKEVDVADVRRGSQRTSQWRTRQRTRLRRSTSWSQLNLVGLMNWQPP